MSQWIGRKLGTYRILTQVRATTLDVVFRAYDEKLGRMVALQIWLPDVVLPPELPKALRTFSGMLAQLKHPNIGSLLDCDVYDGVLCLAYDFVPTRALHRRFHQARTWQQAAQILAPVAQALAYAHRMGVVHGSLRPEQIILKDDGTPVIFDFGVELLVQQELAHAVPESTWLGSDLNTYLAPERALGQRLDPSTDLYSLGMIIVNWMSDQRAYPSETPLGELLARYQDQRPRLKQRLQKLIGRSHAGESARLESVPLHILARVLEPDRGKRMDNSQHFATLLAKAALGQKIPLPLVNNPRWQPFKMQRKHWIGLSGLVLCLLAAGGSLYLQTHPAQASAWAMQAGLITATPSPRPVAGLGSISTPTLRASPTITLTPTVTLTPTLTITPTPTITPIDPRDLPFLPQTPLPTVAQPISRANVQKLALLGRWGLGKSLELAFSADGSQVAMATTTGVYLYKLPDFNPTGFLNTVDPVNALAYLPDGKTIITGENSGLVRLWEAATGAEQRTLSGHSLPVKHLAVSADGKRIASADETMIYLWDAQGDGPAIQLKGHFGTVNDLAFSPNGKLLVSVASDFSVRLWDTVDGKAQANYSNPSRVYSVAFAPNGDKFYTLGGDYAISAWAIGETKPTVLARFNLSYTHMVVAPDGQTLAASGEQGELAAWDSTGKELWKASDQNLPRSLGAVSYPQFITFQPDSKKLVSMLWDNTVTFFDALSGQMSSQMTRFGDFYTRTVISPDSNVLLAETIAGQVKVWDLPVGQVRVSVPGKLLQGRIISADSRFFAVQSAPGEVVVYSVSGEKRFTFSKHGSLVGASFSPDGNLLLTGAPGQLRIWSLVSGLELQTTHNFGLGGCDTIYSLVEQGSQMIAYATRFNFLEFPGRNNDALCYLTAPGWSNLLAYNPDGNLAAVAADRRVSVWDYHELPHETEAENQKKALDLSGALSADDYSKIISMTFSPDETVLAAIFTDGSVRVWDATMSSSPLLQLAAHSAMPTALSISPDSRFLITTAQDGTLRVWGILP